MIDQFMSRQFLMFLLTGGTAAAINLCSRVIYNQWFDFSVSIILAYCTGMIAAFTLSKVFVFRESQQPLHHSATIFIIVNMIAIAQTWLISMGLFYYILPNLGVTLFAKEIAHAVGVMVPVFTSYLGHKHWSFR